MEKRLLALFFVILFLPLILASVYINEVELNPLGTDAGNEWVELYNNGAPVNLNGWYLQDKGSDNYFFPDVIITDFYVLDSLDGLVNTDEDISLFDDSDVLQNQALLLNDGDNDDKTHQRIPDGTGSFVFQTATKGTSNSNGIPNPTFMTEDIDSSGTTDITMGWNTDSTYVHDGIHSIHVTSSSVSTMDYAMVGVPTNFVLDCDTEISYWGYTVAGSGVNAPDEIFLEFEDGRVIINTHHDSTIDQWIEWTLSSSSNWYNLTSPVNIADYHGQKIVNIGLGAGSPMTGPGIVNVYLDNLVVNGNPLLDDDTGTIEVRCGTILGNTGCTSIQDGIDAALPGDTILVADGTYDENIVIDKSLTIQAASNPVIDGQNTLTNPAINIQADDVTVQGFTIQDFICTGADSSSDIGAILVEGDGAKVNDNIVKDITCTGTGTECPCGLGIDVHANNVEIINNIIHDISSIGIRVRDEWTEHTGPDNNVLLEGNEVYKTGNTNVVVTGHAKGVTIKNNEIYGSLEPTPYSLLVCMGSSDIVIEENYIHDGAANIIIMGSWDITITNNMIADAIPHYSNPDAIKGKNIYIRPNTWYSEPKQTPGELSRNIDISGNDIIGATGEGVLILDATGGGVTATTTTINYNNIVGNILYGVENLIATDVDAEYNWWGSCDGPSGVGLGNGDAVSTNVDYTPWLGACIIDKTEEPDCVFETDDVTLSATVTYLVCVGDVLFGIKIGSGEWINYSHTSKVDDVYSYLLSSSLLNAGETVYWTVYADDCYEHITKNGDEEFYVHSTTSLSVNPPDPDGLNGWYITEPEFTLTNPDATNRFYRWDGSGTITYTAPFGLRTEDEIMGGYLKLTWWSDVCTEEPEQNQMFHIDLTNPKFKDLLPEKNSMTINRKPEISVYIEEEYQSNSGINTGLVSMSLNGEPVTANVEIADTLDATATYTPETGLPLGINTVYVYAKDNAGRSNDISWEFEIVECIIDDDCDYLDNNYCDGTEIKHDEGICLEHFCEVQTTLIEDCDDDLYCNGQETCVDATCVAGTPIDCSGNNLLEIATCFNNPDENQLTWDYRNAFTSVCKEPGTCTIGDNTITHTCDISACEAECEINEDCADKCIGNVYYYEGICDAGCECDYLTEDCDSYDNWYDTGNTKWIEDAQCTEKQQKEQEYRDYSCNVEGCDYLITDTQWIDTGNTQNKPLSTTCDADGDLCTIDHCDGVGVCIKESDVSCSHLDDQCQEGVCDSADGLCYANYNLFPLSTTCEADGDLCTIDHCDGVGVCVNYDNVICPDDTECRDYAECNPETGECPYTNMPLSTPCEADDLFCTVDHCDEVGVCIKESDIDCSHLDDECNEGICNEDIDSCEANPVNEGLACNDGLYCNGEETCQSGICTADTPIDCSDDYICTDDSCVEEGHNIGHCENIENDDNCDYAWQVCNPLKHASPTGCGKFELDLTSPEEKTYETKRVLIDALVDKEADEIEYADNSNTFRRLCRNCLGYSGPKTFSEGEHNLKVRASIEDEEEIKEVTFFVDTKEPRIIKTLPKDGVIIKGTIFTIRYTESNLDKISLFWKKSTDVDYNKEELTGCEQGTNRECSINLDLSAYNGEDINYYFEVHDLINIAKSSVKTITIDNINPVVTINAPDNPLYPNRKIMLDIDVNEDVAILEYSLDESRFRRLCRDCDNYNKKKTFSDGQHNLIVRAIDYAGNEGESTIEFSVDSKKPRISRTRPRKNSVVNGSEFYIKYTETNLQNITLFYGTEKITKYNCEVGRNQECIFRDVDLTGYHGQYINYWFEVSDSINTKSSRKTRVKVDTISPFLKVNNPVNGMEYGRRVQFDVEVTNEKVKIIEYQDNLGRWRRLCSRCDSYDRTKSFKRGPHTVNVRAVDYAGNSDEKIVSFNVEY